MPSTPLRLPPLPAAASQASFTAITPFQSPDVIKTALINISTSLLTINSQTTLWKVQQSSRFVVSLRMLHERLHIGLPPPSILPSSSPKPKASTTSKAPNGLASPEGGFQAAKHPVQRPLEDFEDLYYALLSKIQEVYQNLAIRLVNGFNRPDDMLYARGPTIEQLYGMITLAWGELNEPSLVKTLDEAVRCARVTVLHDDILLQRSKGTLTRRDAIELMDDLYSEQVEGLEWIGGWAPSMIGAWLSEKYRITLKAEKEAADALAKQTANKRRCEQKEEIYKMEKRRRAEADMRQAEVDKREEEKEYQDHIRLRDEFIIQANRMQERGRFMRATMTTYMGYLDEDIEMDLDFAVEKSEGMNWRAEL